MNNEVLHKNESRMFGFWLYLMSDLVLFAALFATYAVLHANTFGGPSGKELFSIPFALDETLILLTSSFFSGLAFLAARKRSAMTFVFLTLTFALGAWFVYLEASEFAQLVAEGFGPSKSAFLSAYFTLVGTHGLHVTIGLLWLIALFVALMCRGFSENLIHKITLFTFFWHFLDLVWICIFTVVYLLGVI